MKKEQDFIRDIAEIRSMMERSSKFLSLSGWAGIVAGLIAIAGGFIAYSVYDFNPDEIIYSSDHLGKVILVALLVLVLALVSALYFSWKKSEGRGEKIWNPTSRRLLIHMAVPLVSGGIVIMILGSKGLLGLAAPLSLIFYGIALINAGNYTIQEVKLMGLIQVGLGLTGTWLIEYGLLFWVTGFGLVHIIYGIYMYIRYER